MQHGDKEAARVAAAQTILDRGWGKAVQSIETADVTPLRIIVDYADVPPPLSRQGGCWLMPARFMSNSRFGKNHSGDIAPQVQAIWRRRERAMAAADWGGRRKAIGCRVVATKTTRHAHDDVSTGRR
jgi:hypothetical protein